jgi:hypothetical protein
MLCASIRKEGPLSQERQSLGNSAPFGAPFRSHRSGGWLGGFHHVVTELRDVLPRHSLVFDFAFRAASWFS